MTIARRQEVLTTQDLCDLVNLHSTEHPRIETNHKCHTWIVSWCESCTEAEFYMEVLSNLREECDSNSQLEEVNAINYAISAIKTLEDMEIIHDEQQ